ncbi:hypothetical protein Hanom_Chr02g00104681 [Helianthus anomalus]
MNEGADVVVQPKENLKIHRKQSSKSDLNPKDPKWPKSIPASSEVVLTDDDLDRVAAFSASAALLDNFTAHLTRGKLPRDRYHSAV